MHIYIYKLQDVNDAFVNVTHYKSHSQTSFICRADLVSSCPNHYSDDNKTMKQFITIL